jgi:opacity protein-like surface antigen
MTCASIHSARRWYAMRLLALAVLTGAAVAATGGVARGADMPDEDFLRGTFVTETVRWDGFVLGGHFGYSSMHADFSNATQNMVHDMLHESTLETERSPSQWDVLGSTNTAGSSYGGFIGYNWQWESIIVGLDAAYNKMSGFDTFVGPKSIQRTVSLSDGSDRVFIRASSTLTMHDYATVRARIGYPFGQFMPYAFIGGAVGRFDYATHVKLRVAQDTSVYAPTPQTQSRDNAFSPGVAAGLGVDVALMPNLFLRGEWEYVAFSEIDGIRASVNTVRVGLGLRF